MGDDDGGGISVCGRIRKWRRRKGLRMKAFDDLWLLYVTRSSSAIEIRALYFTDDEEKKVIC